MPLLTPEASTPAVPLSDGGALLAGGVLAVGVAVLLVRLIQRRRSHASGLPEAVGSASA